MFLDFFTYLYNTFSPEVTFFEEKKKKAPAGMRTRKKYVVDTKMTKSLHRMKKYVKI